MGAASDGAEIVKLSKEYAELRPVAEAVETLAKLAAERAGLEEMAGDLSFGILTLRVKVAHREHEQHLQRNMLQTVEAIASIVEMRDPYTSGHQRRVAELAGTIAKKMGMSEEEGLAIRLAGIVHDLGKIKIPAEILSKPSRLNEMEYNLIKMHPQAGYEILKEMDFSWPIAQMVHQHHERMDGSGYPLGIKGDEFLPGSRILAVADSFDAMTSDRSYRKALSHDDAVLELRKNRGKQFDATIVEAFFSLLTEVGTERLVEHLAKHGTTMPTSELAPWIEGTPPNRRS